MGSDAASPWQAVRLGGRVPLPVAPLALGVGRARVVEFAGSAIAPHVVELLRYGCTGSGQRAVDVLGLAPPRPTQQVLTELYEWADIVSLTPNRRPCA